MEQNCFSQDHLVLSAQYTETMEKIVIPYLEDHRENQEVTGTGGKQLFCSVFHAEHPNGNVLFVHGFTENVYKFSEIIYSLLKNGFNVLAYDQRGHGRSWRDETISDISLTHVDHFGEYIQDMEIIMNQKASCLTGPWMVFSHSMGGAVTSLYMEKHPEVFSRAVFCAPMIQPNTGMPQAVVRIMCGMMRILGRRKSRVFISKPYLEKEVFEESSATSRERFDWYEEMRMQHREYQNNGPTYGWTMEAMNVTKQILAPGEPEKITCPVKLYTAEKDAMVLPEAQKAFIDRVKQGSFLFVKDARHEIYRSEDAVLFPWWHDVLQFLQGK